MNRNHRLLSFVATAEMIGLRADKAIGLHPDIGSRNRAEGLIEKNLAKINDNPLKSSQKINPGDVITIQIPEVASGGIAPLDLHLDILFEDSDIIVLNKPAGLVMHPAAGHEQDTLVNALLNHTSDLSMKFGEERPGIVHRLDKETSGVLVVAKNDHSHESLSQQFKARTIHRIYYAACFGVPTLQEGTVKSFLARHPFDRKRYASVIGESRKVIRDQSRAPSQGKWAVTHFRVLENLNSEISLVQLKLETGRTHQIRIHLSEMGNPILGDTLYGAQKRIKGLSTSTRQEIISSLPRFTLHAAELGFVHPRTSRELRFQVPWPDDVRAHLIRLGFKGIL